MSERKDPESLEEIKSIEITDKLKEFVTGIFHTCEMEKQNRSWWDNQIDKYIALRYGIRPIKTFPWVNCANYVVPQIDSDINRLKPSYVNLMNISPMVAFEGYGPEDQEPARLREILYDWRLKTKVDYFKPYVLGIDHMLEQGAFVMKVSWKYSTRNYVRIIDIGDFPSQVISALYSVEVTDKILRQIMIEELMIDTSFEENVAEIDKAIIKFREGETIFELNLVEEKDNQPEWTAVNIREDLIIPINCMDIHEAAFIDYKFPTCKNDIKIAMRDGRYETYSDEQIGRWVSGTPLNKTNRYLRTTPIVGQNTDEIILHETCCWYDVNDDGILEKCIATYPDNDPTCILRFIELPYDHGQWPYNLIKRELNDEGIYSSRSIGQLDEDFQNGISSALNQSIDNGTIVNTPTIVTKRGTLTNIKNLKFVPGQAVETNGPTSDYEVRQSMNGSQTTLFQQAQYLKSWADQRTGNLTSGITAPNNQAGGGMQGQKTAKEIGLVEQLGSEVQSLDLQVFQNQMADVHYQTDALYEQFGNEEEVIAVTGQPPQKISRQEIQGKWNIVPNGKLDNTNPQLRAAKSFNLMRVFLNDPDIRQDELKKLYLMDYDVKLITRLFKTPQEKQQEMKQMQQQQQAAKSESIQTQLGLKKAGDDLEIRKAKLMPEKDRVGESMSFKDLPIDGQFQMAAQAGILLHPEGLRQQKLIQNKPKVTANAG